MDALRARSAAHDLPPSVGAIEALARAEHEHVRVGRRDDHRPVPRRVRQLLPVATAPAAVEAASDVDDRENAPSDRNTATNAERRTRRRSAGCGSLAQPSLVHGRLEERRRWPDRRRRARSGGSPRSGSSRRCSACATCGSSSQTNATATPQFGLTSRGPGTSRAGSPARSKTRSARMACSDAKNETTPPHFKRRSSRLGAARPVGDRAERLDREVDVAARSCRCPRRSGSCPRGRCRASDARQGSSAARRAS